MLDTPCRVDYELKVYVVDDEDTRPQKRNSVRMVVRKLTFAPDEAGPQPTAEVVRDFLMSLGSLRVEASLDKQYVISFVYKRFEAIAKLTTEHLKPSNGPCWFSAFVKTFTQTSFTRLPIDVLRTSTTVSHPLSLHTSAPTVRGSEVKQSGGSLHFHVLFQKYFHGESIVVNVLVDNNSTKTVKKIKLIVRQYTVICLPNASHYKCNVAEINSEEGFPIWPSQTGWCKVYRLCPLLSNNRDKSGLALDGDLKNEDTNLASSTMCGIPPNSSREALGIVVQYKVKIRLVLGFGLSDVCLELPFILTHPNPESSATAGLESALDDFHFTEAGRVGDESSGGEGAEGPPDAAAPNGGAAAAATFGARPQMGVLAKRAATATGRSPTAASSHIAEFLRASEMPDGMAAFAPAVSTENTDTLEDFLGIQSKRRSPSSNGLHFPPTFAAPPSGNCFYHPQPPALGEPSTLHLATTSSHHPRPQQPETDDDDLIFEDFARLRLMQQQKQQTAP
ncbi:unnamed protein product [Mesocestoides corti]|uniref:Arrestin C-terminal-like domain-containing protein n=1 Tax=Mesocestoides corti TaxID=53468 RepID=A0A158QSU0_MESCO|nr:unnamed protein product [Mesocestoides corti]